MMKMWVILLFYFLTCGLGTVKSARILGIFHEKSYSHQQLGNKLLSELANRDHDITMLTTLVPKSTQKHFAVVELDLQGHSTDSASNLFELETYNIFKKTSMINDAELQWTEAILKDENFQKLLKSNKTFDVVIMEQLGNHALKALCHFYNAHCIMLSTMGSTALTDYQMGNPYNPSYVPYRFLNYAPQMSFFQRLRNSYISLISLLNHHFIVLPNHDKLMHKYFPNAPKLEDLMFNVSLMLVNSHYTTSVTVANLPNVVEIGGFHIEPPKELPLEIKTFLDDAENGVVYFSMGSILKSKSMDDFKIKTILKVFSKTKQKILWKFEDDSVEVPANVKTVKWLPQTDVLSHPNVRVFITHGGLLSTTEAIYFGVPIIGIPIFADQKFNVALAEYLGYGLLVDYADMDEKNFRIALETILNNKTFKEVALQKSKIFHDQPMKALDKAVFWIEYCIRHNGAFHLRSAVLNLNWYQYSLLDVIISLSFSIIFIFFIMKILLQIILNNKQHKSKNE